MFLRLNYFGLCLGSVILLLHFVKQHGGQILVLHRVVFAVSLIGDQVGIFCGAIYRVFTV